MVEVEVHISFEKTIDIFNHRIQRDGILREVRRHNFALSRGEKRRRKRYLNQLKKRRRLE